MTCNPSKYNTIMGVNIYKQTLKKFLLSFYFLDFVLYFLYGDYMINFYDITSKMTNYEKIVNNLSSELITQKEHVINTPEEV